jgi:predicted short-subunit dehydrogenase-like oxidoreductase (DUF2520 family)
MIPFHLAGVMPESFHPFVYFSSLKQIQTHLLEALFTITNFFVLDYQEL